MVLRELLAVFGLDYDESGQQEAEKGMAGLTRQVETLGGIMTSLFSAAAVATPFVFLAKMASDAKEDLNLLSLSFGESADDIVQWSNTTGPAIGRSRFTMRQLAAEFGGLLQPMIGTGEQLNEMSKGLSQLAVDLSSARNISEPEALTALQSALSGSTETMKRFGVNLNIARLDQEAFRQGLGKTKDLSTAQRATLIYNTMMKDLAFIQGDAANTQMDFANATRALRDQLKDIGTEIGLFLLPAFEDGINLARRFLKPVANLALEFKEWASNTNLAQGALIGLAAIMGALLLPILLKVIPLVLAFGLFALILDDVITTFKGGDSVISRFTDLLDKLEKEGFPGLTAALEPAITVLNRFRDVLGAIMFVMIELVSGLVEEGNFDRFIAALDLVIGRFDKWLKSLGLIGEAMGFLLKSLVAPLRAIGFLVSAILEGLTSGAGAGIKKLISDFDKADFGALNLGRAAIAEGGKFLGLGGRESGGGFQGERNISIGASGANGRQVVVTGDQNLTFNLAQLPGESSQSFAERVVTIIDEKAREADIATRREQLGAISG